MFTSAIPPTGHPRQSGRPQWASCDSQAGGSGCPRQSGRLQWASTTVRLATVGIHDSQANHSGCPRQAGWRQRASMAGRPEACSRILDSSIQSVPL